MFHLSIVGLPTTECLTGGTTSS